MTLFETAYIPGIYQIFRARGWLYGVVDKSD